MALGDESIIHQPRDDYIDGSKASLAANLKNIFAAGKNSQVTVGNPLLSQLSKGLLSKGLKNVVASTMISQESLQSIQTLSNQTNPTDISGLLKDSE